VRIERVVDCDAFGYNRIADVAIRRLDLASGTIVTCRPDDPDSPDLTPSQPPLPIRLDKRQVAAMTVQVGAALGFPIIRRAVRIPTPSHVGHGTPDTREGALRA
jgi:hypothetical protein